ncbi:GTP-binding protein, HSR1-related [Alkaliphilus metalliredigens QYMF]|uniref:Ribosome biogenesis GTPase A n=1 Tax=Alkaliphilus metalliredigens (strain QYMF) TaxID=293826 RepID=A6TRS4_ALKMQ|nr:ribosome biogenesis GTPase YlqF [Alkaliphilus metalliredigens]ABR48892.1 GTP-binding protein, HSR1-related [Alkaliphilus metalliredigens QYMF]
MDLKINWYPGHMKKTKELLKDQLKLVDVVYELLDARIPISSRNPSINEIIGNKPRVIILNKFDLADQEVTNRWVKYFKAQGIEAIPVNCLNSKGLKEAIEEGQKMFQEKKDLMIKKGRKERPIRIMMVGIPNVGKSSIINQLAGRKSARTGDKPGVTKAKQWIRLKGNMELLDTPGILWPKFEDQNVALKLAFTGAIKDEIMDVEDLAFRLVEKLMLENMTNLMNRYKLDSEPAGALEMMDAIGIKRGAILPGREIDYLRVSNIILDEFRAGIIGRISMEVPPKQ